MPSAQHAATRSSLERSSADCVPDGTGTERLAHGPVRRAAAVRAARGPERKRGPRPPHGPIAHRRARSRVAPASRPWPATAGQREAAWGRIAFAGSGRTVRVFAEARQGLAGFAGTMDERLLHRRKRCVRRSRGCDRALSRAMGRVPSAPRAEFLSGAEAGCRNQIRSSKTLPLRCVLRGRLAPQ